MKRSRVTTRAALSAQAIIAVGIIAGLDGVRLALLACAAAAAVRLTRVRFGGVIALCLLTAVAVVAIFAPQGTSR